MYTVSHSTFRKLSVSFLQAELDSIVENRAKDRAAFKKNAEELVQTGSELASEAKSSRSELTKRIAVALKGRPAFTKCQMSAEELQDASNMIEKSYSYLQYLNRGGHETKVELMKPSEANE